MDKKISIMLIDDNGVDLFIHEKFIQHKAIQNHISKYSNPIEALTFLSNNAIEMWPDVILLDIQMPVMDGFDFLNLYIKLPADKQSKSHIIMLSSTLNYDDINRARAKSEILGLLLKPFNVDEFIELLKTNSIL